MPLSHSHLIEARWIAKKGRGVFACSKIQKGMIIERVPIVKLPVKEVFSWTSTTKLSEYVFDFDDNTVAVALGYGSLYNHSYEPNAEYYFHGRLTQVFAAIRDIDQGEEITVNYNGEPADLSAVGFHVS